MSNLDFILLAGGLGVFLLAMLGTLATVVRNETHVHDLKVRVTTLRNAYAREIRETLGLDEEPVEVSPVDEAEEQAEVEPEQRQAA